MSTILTKLSTAISRRLTELDGKEHTAGVPAASKSSQAAQTQQAKAGSGSSASRHIPITDVTGSRGLVSQKNVTTGSSSASSRIPISDVTGSRGLVSQKNNSESDGSGSNAGSQTPHIPISVVTGSRDITTVSSQLRAYLLQGSPSATTAIPKKYADLANLLEKATPNVDFSDWADMTTKQQQNAMQRSGLTAQEQWALLNATPHYVQTIAKIQDLFASRYELGLTVSDARNIAKELFSIADERDAAIHRTGKYANDAGIVPKVLRWLDEQEAEILDRLGKDTNETGYDTWYNGGNPDLAARAARRASYDDIDDAAATKQIEDLLMKNIASARKLSSLSETESGGLAAESAQMLWFYNNVKKDSPMDYKNQIIWDKALPGLPYPEEDQIYNVFGIDISSSDLGNLNYALIGKALGIPETLLLQQAGAAQLRDHRNVGLIRSEIESLSDRNYGDEEQDQGMIKTGFNIYNSFN